MGPIDTNGRVSIDGAAPCPVVGDVHPAVFTRALFHGHLRAAGKDGESAAFVLDQPARDLHRQRPRGPARRARDPARYAYATSPPRSIGCARSQNAATGSTSHMMSNCPGVCCGRPSQPSRTAWKTRGSCDSSTPTATSRYYATYTAYDGNTIRQQLAATKDFVTFDVSSLAGRIATNKGLALFPRRINGRFAALSRFDRETNAIAFSDDPHIWEHATTLQVPQQSWEVIQLGNCGPPIETPDGWLVLTHGVGPMRTYSIGALLLDLHDPTKIIGQLRRPLLAPEPDEQDGYVPNVVYSCGGLLHGDTLVIPYGIADTSTGIATVSWTELRNTLLAA